MQINGMLRHRSAVVKYIRRAILDKKSTFANHNLIRLKKTGYDFQSDNKRLFILGNLGLLSESYPMAFQNCNPAST